jgi:YVTN family beta-propeller protein
MIGKAVVRIDPQTNQIIDRIQLEGGLHAIALDGDTLWVANRGDDTIVRVDTQTKQIVARIPVHDPTSIAIGANSVWVVGHRAGNLVRIDPNTNSVVATIRLGQGVGWPGQVAFGEGGVWVGELLSGMVSRVDPETNKEVARIDIGVPVTSIEVGAGAVWAVVGEFEGCQKSGLVRIDPETNMPVGRIPVRCAGDMVVSPEGFWVTSYQYPEITLVKPQE